MADKTVLAEEFQAEKCPFCDAWIFVDAAPFGENDRTKPIRGMLHLEREHASELDVRKQGDATVIGYPWMHSNTDRVMAVLEEVSQ